MSRILRSNSRWKKLQVQRIQQVDRALRVNISNCTETKIDSFEQQEFLSLFGLIPIKQRNGTIKRRKLLSEQLPPIIEATKQGVIVASTMMERSLRKRAMRDDTNNNNNRFDNNRSKRRITLGKLISVYADICISNYISIDETQKQV